VDASTIVPYLPDHALTPREAARFMGRSRESVMALIRSGKLGASVSPGCRPRYLIWPHHLAAYAAATAPEQPKPARRKKRIAAVDFFPNL
jgi:hypothetical protein